LEAIGARFGVSRQAVLQVLRRGTSPRLFAVACCRCGADIVSAGLLSRDAGTTACLACVLRDPAATFGQRLKAYRLAAGLTIRELERAVPTATGSVSNYERDRSRPKPPARVRLALALGVSLEKLEGGGQRRKAN
jgi:hypothetical protein